jgi:hypothetical protein
VSPDDDGLNFPDVYMFLHGACSKSETSATHRVCDLGNQALRTSSTVTSSS